jgi:formamidopyrimidine-DNA glycosylase
MPELPEVEVTRQGFANEVAGALVLSARVGKPLRWPLGVAPEALVGLQLGHAVRRGKYLWLPLSGGAHSGGLLVHLGMSGTLTHWPNDRRPWPPVGGHDHFDLVTTHGLLRLNDPRRFGAVVWGASMGIGRVGQLLAGLGVEPFEPAWNARHLREGLAGRRVSIKQALLAGHIVVGVGNIYASEALFRAGIHPQTLAHRVGPTRCDRLVTAVREVLTEAVAAGGSTLKDFRNAQGQAGHFQLATMVYDRAGQPCKVCGSLVHKIVQGQRSTYFCATCQRR